MTLIHLQESTRFSVRGLFENNPQVLLPPDSCYCTNPCYTSSQNMFSNCVWAVAIRCDPVCENPKNPIAWEFRADKSPAEARRWPAASPELPLSWRPQLPSRSSSGLSTTLSGTASAILETLVRCKDKTQRIPRHVHVLDYLAKFHRTLVQGRCGRRRLGCGIAIYSRFTLSFRTGSKEGTLCDQSQKTSLICFHFLSL